MKWRDAGWFLALALLAAYFLWIRPAKLPNLAETKALVEKHRQFREEAEARHAKLEQELAAIRTEATLKLLKIVGQAYRRHLAEEKAPPKADDYKELLDAWKSERDDQPFVIQWGVDLTKLPDGGRGMLLAWEQTGAADGSRCVLMADGETAKVVTADEFKDLPQAK